MMTGDDVTLGRPQEWPAKDVAKLENLVKQHLTAREIGNIMGRTRNSIIGKLRRLGLHLALAWTDPLRPRARIVRERGKPTTPQRPPQSPPEARRAPSKLRPSRWDHPTDAKIVPVNNGRGITLLKLNMSQCHTVIGSTRPKKGLARYCGQPAWNGTTYCEDHFAVFHRPPQPRR